MSAYEDYHTTASVYDDTRVPVGLDLLLGGLAAGAKPVHAQAVLDAGCGTGSYAAALLGHVGTVTGVDINPSMLAVARRKLAGAIGEGRASLHEAPLTALPLDDSSVDAAVVNQVLHHLPDTPHEGWPLTGAVLAELARVLRPGGALVVNTCSHEQLRHGWWYTALIPEAVDRMTTRHVAIERLESLLAAAGLEVRGRAAPTAAVFQGERYFDSRGPLDPSWRASDSLWALVTADELERVGREVRALDAAGELDHFLARNDRRRPEIGQVTFVHAVKAPGNAG